MLTPKLNRSRFVIWSLFPILGVLLFTGCRSFDPAPYQQSAARVRHAAAESEAYEARWHDALLAAWEADHVQAMSILRAKLITEVFDNLIKQKEPLSAEDQDTFFPVDGNRSAARAAWLGDIRKIISDYTIEVEIAGQKTPFDLIKMYIEERSATDTFQKLTAPQRRFYSDGIARLKLQIVAIPVVARHEADFEAVKSSLQAHKEFTAQLARQHAELELDLIGGLQSAASALEANAWLVQIGNNALGGLNGLMGKAPPPPAAKPAPPTP